MAVKNVKNKNMDENQENKTIKKEVFSYEFLLNPLHSITRNQFIFGLFCLFPINFIALYFIVAYLIVEDNIYLIVGSILFLLVGYFHFTLILRRLRDLYSNTKINNDKIIFIAIGLILFPIILEFIESGLGFFLGFLISIFLIIKRGKGEKSDYIFIQPHFEHYFVIIFIIVLLTQIMDNPISMGTDYLKDKYNLFYK